ncbi:MAG: STAS domain-containing protein [Ilumatobacteraceae bacterium]
MRLVPIGEIDVNSASTFTIAGEFAIDEAPEHIHIDLSRVTFIDSSGVRGIDVVVDSARAAGVPCTIIGRDIELVDSIEVARPMVIWSGSTTRLVALPRN